VREVELTQGKVALIDDEDFELVSQYNWKFSNRGYAARNYWIDGKSKTLLMHRLIMSPPEGVFIDHINGDTLDNRKQNLRLVRNQQNCCNQKLGLRNKSGYKGVYQSKGRKKWTASLKTKGKTYYLGDFESKHDAARMYNFWAHDMFGEYARLNVIKEETK